MKNQRVGARLLATALVAMCAQGAAAQSLPVEGAPGWSVSGFHVDLAARSQSRAGRESARRAFGDAPGSWAFARPAAGLAMQYAADDSLSVKIALARRLSAGVALSRPGCESGRGGPMLWIGFSKSF